MCTQGRWPGRLREGDTRDVGSNLILVEILGSFILYLTRELDDRFLLTGIRCLTYFAVSL